MNKSIFGTRFKNELKSQGYTFVSFAKKLGYTEDAIKRWTRTKNPSMPNLETMRKIADILNVDMSYLLGDQECRHHQEQTIMDVTGLSKEACETLWYMKNSGRSVCMTTLDFLLRDEKGRFVDLLYEIWVERLIANEEPDDEISFKDFVISNLLKDMYKDIDPNELMHHSAESGHDPLDFFPNTVEDNHLLIEEYYPVKEFPAKKDRLKL